jgi:prepilin-type processing-associated H-X9-DG protein
MGSVDHMGCWSPCLNWQGQARSRHTGGVNACFADGSVHFITDAIDQGTWFYLLSAADGVTPNW